MNRRQSINSNGPYCLEKETAYLDVAPIYNTDILTSSNTRPLTRSDTEMTFNTYWDRMAAVPTSNEGSIRFEYQPNQPNATGTPASNLLSRTDTVSSFNSTWDEHIISSSRRDDSFSFSEHSDDLLNTQAEYEMGASLSTEDDSQVSDREEINSDDDSGTECGDYSEFHPECSDDINMDHSEANHVPTACGLPSPLPSVNDIYAPTATPGQATGLMTRARARRMKYPHLGQANDAGPVPKKARLGANKSPAFTIIPEQGEIKRYYWCNFCAQTNENRGWMIRHVRDKHASQNSEPTGR